MEGDLNPDNTADITADPAHVEELEVLQESSLSSKNKTACYLNSDEWEVR